MSKYVCEPIIKNQLGFGIIETETKRCIARSDLVDVCKDYLSKLNKGSGFNGKTPEFFCTPIIELD